MESAMNLFTLRLKTAAICLCSMATALLSGCAISPQDSNPTTIDAQWVNPSATFEQKTITGILVADLSDNPTSRRIFEDVASNVLAFHGIPAQPSYQYLSDPQSLVSGNSLNVSSLMKAARKIKASDILVVKSRGIKINVIYNPGMTWGPDPFWGPGPWGGPFGPGPFGPDPFWGGWAIPPSVTQQQIAETNAELMSAQTAEVLWTGSFSTVLGAKPANTTFQEYAELIVQALIHNGFLIPVSQPDYQIKPAAKFDPAASQPAQNPAR